MNKHYKEGIEWGLEKIFCILGIIAATFLMVTGILSILGGLAIAIVCLYHLFKKDEEECL